MDPAFALAENIARTDFEGLPERTVNNTKRLILDSLGVALAGAHAKECLLLIDLVRHWEGRPESTIIGHALKAPSPMAALINGTIIQALDFDDTHDGSGAHTASCVLPAALAVAEAQNAGGRLLITAVALGMDLIARIGASCQEKIGWTSTAVYGCFGAAAAAAKVLRLDHNGIRHALGIVLSQAAGTTQTAIDSPLSKHMQSGFASKAGVLSALLAGSGATGVQEVFEGKFGFFRLYKADRYDRAVLLNDLGKRFDGDALSLKPFPCCRAAHGPIEAVKLLTDKHRVGVDDISGVRVVVPQIVYDLTGRPFNPGHNPVISAQFSIPYTVAAALVYQKVTLEEFTLPAISNPRIREVVKRVSVEVDTSLGPNEFVPVEVEITTTNGSRYAQTIEVLKGHPDNPLDEDELLEKFTRCVNAGPSPIAKTAVQELIHTINRLESVENVSEVTRHLRPVPVR